MSRKEAFAAAVDHVGMTNASCRAEVALALATPIVDVVGPACGSGSRHRGRRTARLGIGPAGVLSQIYAEAARRVTPALQLRPGTTL